MLEPMNCVAQFSAKAEDIIKNINTSETFINFICLNMSSVKLRGLGRGVHVFV